MAPSARAALLLHLAAFDATRPELERLVGESLGELLTIRPDVTALALSIAADLPRPLRPTLFVGTRRYLPAGKLSDARVGAINSQTAARILMRPERWPADLVTTAQVILSSGLSQLPALAEVAGENSWFSG